MDWTVLETATRSDIFPRGLAAKSSFGVDNRANPADPFPFGPSLADEESVETELEATDVAISAPSGLTETIRTDTGLAVCEAGNGGLGAEFATTGVSTVVATAVALKPSIAGCGAPAAADVRIGGELWAAGCFSESLMSLDDATVSPLGGWALIGSRVAATEDKFLRKSEMPPLRAKCALIMPAPANASAEATSFQLGERNCLASSGRFGTWSPMSRWSKCTSTSAPSAAASFNPPWAFWIVCCCGPISNGRGDCWGSPPFSLGSQTTGAEGGGLLGGGVKDSKKRANSERRSSAPACPTNMALSWRSNSSTLISRDPGRGEQSFRTRYARTPFPGPHVSLP
jgi:hypothetical protein